MSIIQTNQIKLNLLANFDGDIHMLMTVLGFIDVGIWYGWRVMRITYGKQTIANYEKIIGCSIKEIFQEKSSCTYRSAGFRFVEKQSNFWKYANGNTPVPNRNMLN